MDRKQSPLFFKKSALFSPSKELQASPASVHNFRPLNEENILRMDGDNKQLLTDGMIEQRSNTALMLQNSLGHDTSLERSEKAEDPYYDNIQQNLESNMFAIKS